MKFKKSGEKVDGKLDFDYLSGKKSKMSSFEDS